MLQIKNISKRYVTGELTQVALDNVSLNLRDNEFVSILGPSGSGKTTLLNVIGGLDRYDSGDLIINGISTKKYKSRDWDYYRNHTIGFVFQSYNLIEHQSILSNVELALTISGVKRKERRRRAKEALEKVGLGNQVHKRPNQLSGGQMQRVAIARALVNNPSVLLADEPTGALDSETSIQVMELLREVAKDKLVVMVTHNPELANEYSTRIVNIKDGAIVGDTNPYEVDAADIKEPEHKKMGKASMSPLTALALSFNNLRTKKGRTILTSFAGSIGIIGIALILSLSTGVNNYIDDIQRDTMTSYPIVLEAQTMDLSGFLDISEDAEKKNEHDKDAVYSDNTLIELESTMMNSFTKNNLTEFKNYLEDNDSDIHHYIGEIGVVYSYDTKFDIFSFDPDGVLVKTDGSTLYQTKAQQMTNAEMQMMGEMGMSTEALGMFYGGSNFEELIPGQGDTLISPIVTDNYEVIKGRMPSEYNEVVLVLNRNNEVSATALYQLGLLPSVKYEEYMKQIDEGEELNIPVDRISYDDILDKEFTFIPASDYYVKQEDGTFKDISTDPLMVQDLVNNSKNSLKIVGIIRPYEDADNLSIANAVGYTRELTNYLIDYANNSEIVKAQQADDTTNVLLGLKFDPEDDSIKIEEAKAFISTLGITGKAQMYKNMITMDPTAVDPAMMEAINQMDEVGLAGMMDQYMQDPDDEFLLSIYSNYISTGTYDDNMEKFGVVSYDAPSSISIYADSFEAKDGITECIEKYNANVSEENKISYTDYVGLLMSSITTIVNIISYVLIAFVSVSLIVSSIMIGIITYISVLERTKEIGILRAMGASKSNISQVFISETLIVGLFAGLMGIGITLLTLIPANAIIHALAESTAMSATLPVVGAIILVILSVLLTVIGGLVPSKKAAKMDPVTALRSE